MTDPAAGLGFAAILGRRGAGSQTQARNKGSIAIDRFVFPKWTNSLRTVVAGTALFAAMYVAGIVTFGFSPYATDVGYMPAQPVPYSHALHVGKLNMDCRYCHTGVEIGAHATIPPTQTCMGCHASVGIEEARKWRIAPVLESHETGMPIPWVRIHDLPDYSYFDHSAHVLRGIGCVSCHGRVDKMEVVYQAEPLSMSWCIDCHRNPEKHLRPVEEVTNMAWVPPGPQEEIGRMLREQYDINPPLDCSACHR